MTERIGVALSGGADSALAAAMLFERGCDVFALHLVLTRSVASRQLAERASELADRLGIPCELLDVADAFESTVIAPFCEEYSSGRTPNPCVTCNRRIKFGILLEAAAQRGADALATGHYARVQQCDGRHELLRAADHQADQSYFLYALEPTALERLVLPLGELPRSAVRTMAYERGLVTGKSSQDVCFLAGHDLSGFIEQHSRATPGDIIDLEGRVRGRHRGLPFYTVGQRHGLGIAFGEPMYVVRIDVRQNAVIVGNGDALLSSAARLESVRWLVPPDGGSLTAQARVRYRSRPASARVTLTGDTAVVRFREPQRAVAPGQSIVFYRDDSVLGGGVVREVLTEESDAR